MPRPLQNSELGAWPSSSPSSFTSIQLGQTQRIKRATTKDQLERGVSGDKLSQSSQTLILRRRASESPVCESPRFLPARFQTPTPASKQGTLRRPSVSSLSKKGLVSQKKEEVEIPKIPALATPSILSRLDTVEREVRTHAATLKAHERYLAAYPTFSRLGKRFKTRRRRFWIRSTARPGNWRGSLIWSGRCCSVCWTETSTLMSPVES